MIIRDADCIAGTDLALSGTVHVNDLAVPNSPAASRNEAETPVPLLMRGFPLEQVRH